MFIEIIICNDEKILLNSHYVVSIAKVSMNECDIEKGAKIKILLNDGQVFYAKNSYEEIMALV